MLEEIFGWRDLQDASETIAVFVSGMEKKHQEKVLRAEEKELWIVSGMFQVTDKSLHWRAIGGEKRGPKQKLGTTRKIGDHRTHYCIHLRSSADPSMF